MKFLLSFLLKFLPFECNFLSAQKIADILTNHIIEVENFFSLWSSLDGYQVAEVISCESHPKSERLKICKVECSNKSIIQVICGAPNVSIGMKSVLAPIGVYLPNSQNKIEHVKILGIDSFGMLCSERELGISDMHKSIISLPNSAKAGEHPAKYLLNDDFIFQVNITPNMAYCLSIKNLATELAAAIKIQNLITENDIIKDQTNKNDFLDCNKTEFNGFFESNFNINLNSSDCNKFLIIEINDIDNSIETPSEIKKILKASDIKSVSPVVDILNYTMIITGQPMHAYDADKLFDQEIYISNFNDFNRNISQTNFLALDENQYDLHPESIIIHDKEKICCLAGIIGSNDTKCTNNTKNIIIESAEFNKSNITKAGQFTKINTQAKYRFERGIETNFLKNAIIFACNLITKICGGQASYIKEKTNKNHIDSEIQISIFPQQLKKFLSIEITNCELISVLKTLQYKIKECYLQNDESIAVDQLDGYINEEIKELSVAPPSYKKKFINNTAEVYSEIIRLYGYDKIESKINFLPASAEKLSNDFSEQHNDFKAIRIALSSIGYNELINWSFDSLQDDNEINKIKIVNFISENMNCMRSTALNNMLKNIEKNKSKLEKNISFFEIGANYKNDKDKNFESIFISLMLSGNFSEKGALTSERFFDIFDLKKGVEEIFFSILGIENFVDEYCELSKIENNIYHSTRSSNIVFQEHILGSMGEVNPKYLSKFNIDLDNSVYFAELEYEIIKKLKKECYLKNKFSLSEFQPVIREFCFVVDKTIKISQITSIVRNLSKLYENKIIKEVRATDIYENDKELGSLKKSVSITVLLQPENKTFTSEELANISEQIIQSAKNHLGAVLRLEFDIKNN